MNGGPPRVVLDCNVFLQAAGRLRGPAAACMGLVWAGQVTLIGSDEVLAEIRDVLSRPRVRRKFPALTPLGVSEFISRVERVAEKIDAVPSSFRSDRDPKDECYVNLAAAGRAEYLVTRDKDLLVLMDEQNLEGQALRALSASLMVLDPVAFLNRIAAQSRDRKEPIN